MSLHERQISATSPELILFGGSFDPPHKGHLDCVFFTLAYFPGAQICLVPAFRPAGAGGAHKEPEANFEQRLAMCRLLFEAGLAREHLARLTISRLEETLPSPNLTVNTLRAIVERFHLGPLQLCFLMGEDQWVNFPRWARPLEILSLSSLLVVKRKQSTLSSRDLREEVEDGVQSLGLTMQWMQPDCADLGPEKGRIYCIDTAPKEATSTLMRRHIGEETEMPDGWLTKEVEDFISEHRLYRTKKGFYP